MKRLAVCSIHFKPEDFERRFPLGLTVEVPHFQQRLKKDELGICVYHHPNVVKPVDTNRDRNRRKVREFETNLVVVFR